MTLENNKYKKECNVPSLIKENEGLLVKGNTAFFRNKTFKTGCAAEEFCKIAGYTGLQNKANFDTSYSSCNPGDSWFATKDGDYYVGYYNKAKCVDASKKDKPEAAEGWSNAHWHIESDGYPTVVAL